MTWHIDTVFADSLDVLLAAIRRAAGTVTKCEREANLIRVTWTTPA